MFFVWDFFSFFVEEIFTNQKLDYDQDALDSHFKLTKKLLKKYPSNCGDGLVVDGYSQALDYFKKCLSKNILNGDVKLECEVIYIKQDNTSCIVGYLDHKNFLKYEIICQAVICTVPLPILKKMAFFPKLPDSKNQYLSKLSYGIENKFI